MAVVTSVAVEEEAAAAVVTAAAVEVTASTAVTSTAVEQGLALVHVRAQLEKLQDTLRAKLGYMVDRRAQDELKPERA
jgi:hypothetical protein